MYVNFATDFITALLHVILNLLTRGGKIKLLQLIAVMILLIINQFTNFKNLFFFSKSDLHPIDVKGRACNVL